jgi:hypothetical protein
LREQVQILIEPPSRKDAKINSSQEMRRIFATDINQMHTDEGKLIQLFFVSVGDNHQLG